MTQMRDYREDHAIHRAWPVSERLLVCVGPGQHAEHLVRAARRLATSLAAEWIALYVETPNCSACPKANATAFCAPCASPKNSAHVL